MRRRCSIPFYRPIRRYGKTARSVLRLENRSQDCQPLLCHTLPAAGQRISYVTVPLYLLEEHEDTLLCYSVCRASAATKSTGLYMLVDSALQAVIQGGDATQFSNTFRNCLKFLLRLSGSGIVSGNLLAASSSDTAKLLCIEMKARNAYASNLY